MMHWYPFIGIGMGLLLLVIALVVAGHLMVLFWPIVLIAVVYLIYKLIKSEKILAPSRPIVRSVEDILSERHAKGDLTREQYMQMKEDLKKVQ